MATLPGGQTIGANQVNIGTAGAPLIKTVGATNDANTVLTQGQSFTDPAGRTGTVNYDTSTGAKLPTGGATFASPTTVVSSNAAMNSFNSMAQQVQTANQAQTTQATVNKQNATTPVPVPVPAPVPPPPTTGSTTAEEKIANAPDTGMQEAYNVQTGQRQDQPANAPLPTGYTATNPATRTDVVATADAGDGIQIKQFSDGTYGRFNTVTGTYTAGTQGQFQQAQSVTNTQQALTNLQNGIYTPGQQNQITAIQQGYAALIQQQQQANANATGAVTLAENMYGLGNSLIGAGQITQSINDGIAKVSALQSKMNSDISNLTEQFNQDDTTAAKNAFDEYSTTQQGIQKELDDMQAQIEQAKQDQLEQQKFQEQQQQDAFQDQMDSAKFTYQQKQDAIQNRLAAGTLSVDQQRLALQQQEDLRDFNAQYGGLLDPTTGLLKQGQTLDGLGTQTTIPGIGSVTDTGSAAFNNLPKGVQNLVTSNSAGGITIDSSTPQGKQFIANAGLIQTLDTSGLSDNDPMNGRALHDPLTHGGNVLSPNLSKDPNFKSIPNVGNMTVGQAKSYLQNQMATTAGVPVQVIKYADPKAATTALAQYAGENPTNKNNVDALRQSDPSLTPIQIIQALNIP